MTGTKSDTVTHLDQLAPGDTFETLPGAEPGGVFEVCDPISLVGGSHLTVPADTVVVQRLSDGLLLAMNEGVQVLKVPYGYSPVG